MSFFDVVAGESLSNRPQVRIAPVVHTQDIDTRIRHVTPIEGDYTTTQPTWSTQQPGVVARQRPPETPDDTPESSTGLGHNQPSTSQSKTPVTALPADTIDSPTSEDGVDREVTPTRRAPPTRPQVTAAEPSSAENRQTEGPPSDSEVWPRRSDLRVPGELASPATTGRHTGVPPEPPRPRHDTKPEVRIPPVTYPPNLARGSVESVTRWLTSNADVLVDDPGSAEVSVNIDRVIFEQPPPKPPDREPRERPQPQGFGEYDSIRRR